MATVYTRRFGAVYHTVPEVVTMFTASNLFVWILRDLVVANLAAAAGNASVYIQAGPQRFDLLEVASLEPGACFHLELRQEILPDELLLVGVSSNSWTALATGYALTPP